MNKHQEILEGLRMISESADPNKISEYAIDVLKGSKLKCRDIKVVDIKGTDTFDISISCLCPKKSIDKIFSILANGVKAKFRLDGIGVSIQRNDIRDDMQSIVVEIDNH